MPQGKGTYKSKVGRPPKKGMKGNKKPSAAVIIAMNKGGKVGKSKK